MGIKRKLSINRILFALILTILVFLTVFLISYSVSYSKYQQVSKQQSDSLYRILSFNIRNSLSNYSCTGLSADLGVEIDNMGSIVNLLEQRFGKQDAQVLEQKKLYSALEIEHFLYVLDYNKKCNQSVNTILFFYSNDALYSAQADKTGYILSSLKSRNSSRVMIYSFDYDLDADVISALKARYYVNQPNTVVVNEDNKVVNVRNIGDLEGLIR